MIIGFLSGGFIGLVAGIFFLCPSCSHLLLNGKFRDDWCPNCKTRINWQKVDESEGKEKCGK